MIGVGDLQGKLSFSFKYAIVPITVGCNRDIYVSGTGGRKIFFFVGFKVCYFSKRSDLKYNIYFVHESAVGAVFNGDSLCLSHLVAAGTAS